MKQAFFQWQAYRGTGGQKGSLGEVTAWLHFHSRVRLQFVDAACEWTEPAAFAKLNIR
jgi:hypothetical protein